MEEECFNELLGERRGPGPVVARCERITSVNNATLYLRYLFLMMANIPDTNRSPSVISSRLFLLAEDQLTRGKPHTNSADRSQ